jgi:hypothetical protein
VHREHEQVGIPVAEKIHNASNDNGDQRRVSRRHDKAVRPASRIALRKQLIEIPDHYEAKHIRISNMAFQKRRSRAASQYRNEVKKLRLCGSVSLLSG